MLFAIDIDGTIGGQNDAVFLSITNERCRLGLGQDKCMTLEIADFYELPEVTAYKTSVGAERFAEELCWNRLDPRHLAVLRPVRNSLEGIWRLSTHGDIAYYTARKVLMSEQLNVEFANTIESFNMSMAEATRSWLKTEAFPSPDNVVFCDNPQDKLYKIAAHIHKTGQPAILVDDQYLRLLEILPQLDRDIYDILKVSFTLCAFGAEQLLDQTDLRSVALPDWKHIHLLEEEIYV